MSVSCRLMFANHRTLHIICPCEQRVLFCPAVNCRYQESMQVLNSLATSNRYQVHCGKFWVPCDTRETSTFAERLKKFQNIQTSLFLSTFLYLESEFRHWSLSTIHLLDVYVHRGHGYTHQKGIIPFTTNTLLVCFGGQMHSQRSHTHWVP